MNRRFHLQRILGSNKKKPSKLILTAKERKLLWYILLEEQRFEDKELAKLWLLSSGAANLLSHKSNENYYFYLRDHNMLYPNPCFNQIDLDLRRTFPNENQNFVEKYIDSLKNVLYTFVKRNPTIGYCQGMNFIVGNLLKILSEEESFWVFVSITENILPIDYYSDMLGIIVD